MEDGDMGLAFLLFRSPHEDAQSPSHGAPRQAEQGPGGRAGRGAERITPAWRQGFAALDATESADVSPEASAATKNAHGGQKGIVPIRIVTVVSVWMARAAYVSTTADKEWDLRASAIKILIDESHFVLA